MKIAELAEQAHSSAGLEDWQMGAYQAGIETAWIIASKKACKKYPLASTPEIEAREEALAELGIWNIILGQEDPADPHNQERDQLAADLFTELWGKAAPKIIQHLTKTGQWGATGCAQAAHIVAKFEPGRWW